MLGEVAVLSDVHGVLPALVAVLAEPEVAAADHVVVTGDHAAGPQPAEVLDRPHSLDDRVTLVRGNADRALVALARGEAFAGAPDVSVWAAAQLEERHVELLADRLGSHAHPVPPARRRADYFLRATVSDVEALDVFRTR